MGKIGVDFGTGNTVLARFNETNQRAETLRLPGISTELRYRLNPGAPEQVVSVIPSLIHYSETETLIGDQVLSRGLSEHVNTFRWMKRYVAQGGAKTRKTPQGHKSPLQAGEDFLRLVLTYVRDQVSFERDEFTFTAPTEAFEKYADWLRRLYESMGIQRLRLLDEPTACVFGYHGASRKDDAFVVFDFGCGTLDISAVQVDLLAAAERKALQLGQAGHDIGGMDIDGWIRDDFCQRHSLDEHARRELEAVLLLRAEETKITLSDPAETEADMMVLLDQGGKTSTLLTTYQRSCWKCEPGRPPKSVAPPCLGCILLEKAFLRRVRETLDRALENAAVKAGLRRDRVIKVLVTGGTSLVPSVRKMLEETFDGRTEYQSPFDAVARGACSGVVLPVLQHDYAIEGYNRERKRYEFQPLFKRGTEFPISPEDAVQMWARGSYDGQTRIALRIYEVSQLKGASLSGAIMDGQGRLEENRVISEYQHNCLNSQNPTFIVADPPVMRDRDKERFLCRFSVDGQRRLLVTVFDKMKPEPLYKDHPVVRL